MNALKARWIVTAEIIMGQPIEQFTRVWEYTSADSAKDQADPSHSIFMQYLTEANQYAMELQDPARVNVVNLQFMWM